MSRLNYLIIILLTLLITISVFFIILSKDKTSFKPELMVELSSDFKKNELGLSLPEPEVEKDPLKIVKGIYITSWSASRKDYVDYIINLARDTEINAVIIDIKDWSGSVSYDSKIPKVEEYNARKIIIKDIDSLIRDLQKEGIYLIARISIFQDPKLAKARPDLAIQSVANPDSLWFDNLGLAWIDPAAKESWDYNIAIAKEAISLGFDEINFDYIRFPSDGDLKDMNFPIWDKKTSRHLIIKEFFKHLRQELPEAKLSADLFGLTTISSGDLGIGQIIEDSFQYFDYICPMIYPSHYAPGFLGYENPAEYPYEIVKGSMNSALEKLAIFNESKETNAKLRPWLQDFNLGATYDAEMVKIQIKAVQDSAKDHFNGFMLWNSSNIYTKKALLPAD